MGRAVSSAGYRQHRQGDVSPVYLSTDDEAHHANSALASSTTGFKYTFADYMKPFEMRYTTIKRDSGLLKHAWIVPP